MECYTRTTSTNGEHDATAETPTSATATTAPADENDDDPDDEHEYVNTKTDKNIESKKSHRYDIDKQCSKQSLNVTNVSQSQALGLGNVNQKIQKQSKGILFNCSKIVLTVDVINILNCVLPIIIDITHLFYIGKDLNDS